MPGPLLIQPAVAVTASRLRLRELIRSADTATSDFWNIFDPNPIQVGPFDAADRQAAFERVSSIELHSGLEQEVVNWTGSFPPLFLSFLNELKKAVGETAMTPKLVGSIGMRTLELCRDTLGSMWDDYDQATKDKFLDLYEAGELANDSVVQDVRAQISGFGLGIKQGDKIKPSCHLLSEYVKLSGSDPGSVSRLFREYEGFRENFRSILEMRLDQIDGLDPLLKHSIKRCLTDIPEFPTDCLGVMRRVSERAFALIWKAEFGGENRFPEELYEYWRHVGLRDYDRFESLRVPEGLGPQCRLLQLLVGADHQTEKKSQYISKGTYALLSAIQGFGDLGQHTDGEEIDLSVAISAAISAIELASLLSKELSSQATATS